MFYKDLSDETRMVMVMYVDDGYVIDEQSNDADKELDIFHAAFKLTVKPAAFVLGANIHTQV